MTPKRALLVSLSCASLGWLLTAAPLSATPPVADLEPVRPLPTASVLSVFHIEKSENRNQVHYAVRVDGTCRPVGPSPVYGYWREFEHGPRVVSPLLDREQPAYGLTEPRAIVPAPAGGQVRISLRGFPDRPLTIETFRAGPRCGARAITVIAKQPAELTSIYVEIGFLFSVEYAIIRGVRLSDGLPVQEKVND